MDQTEQQSDNSADLRTLPDAPGRPADVVRHDEGPAHPLHLHKRGRMDRPELETTKPLHDAMRGRAAEIEQIKSEISRQSEQVALLIAQGEEIDELRRKLVELEARITALEPKPKVQAPRLPWKVRLAKKIAGPGYYVPWRGLPPLPTISVITPVKNGEKWIRQTVESVLGQGYPDLEYIVVDGGSTDRTLDILREYRGRITRIISEPDRGMYDAIHKGFSIASGDVLGYLNADDVYEPGGLLRVGEYFRRHPRAKVIYHEDTVTMDGWRFPNRAQPRVDVYKLLAGHTLFQDGIFFRKSAYTLVGGLDREMKRAGDWDLWVRMARMFGLRRVPGHVSSFRIRPGQISEDREAYEAELNTARQRFLGRFGLLGRIRCRIIRAINALRNGIEQVAGGRRMFWPIDYCGKPYPPGDAPPIVPGKPICPLTGKAPDRLLFSTRDTRFGDSDIHYVYYDSSVGMAMAYPPVDQNELDALYERHYSDPPTTVTPADPAYHSPYKNFRGGNIVARNLYRIPSPWWWFNRITYHDASAEEVIRSVRTFASPQDGTIRFLDVGCFEGELLDRLKEQTQWQLFGLEANAKAVEAAQGKGHRVWKSSAEDAALVVPEEHCFDVIYLGQTMEHLDNPLGAINRLRPLLAAGGAFIVSLPNLDSKQVEFFGPTWAHWHLPYHRTLLSRRALRRLAQLAGLKVEHLRTRTHPYWTTMSVQLNRLGLGAVVPHTAYFSNVMAMHSTRLTGWCRLLWDWRGRGDYMFAVLRPA